MTIAVERLTAEVSVKGVSESIAELKLFEEAVKSTTKQGTEKNEIKMHVSVPKVGDIITESFKRELEKALKVNVTSGLGAGLEHAALKAITPGNSTGRPGIVSEVATGAETASVNALSGSTAAVAGIGSTADELAKTGMALTEIPKLTTDIAKGFQDVGDEATKAGESGTKAMEGMSSAGGPVGQAIGQIVGALGTMLQFTGMIALYTTLFGALAAAVVIATGAVVALASAVGGALVGALSALPGLIGAAGLAFGALMLVFQPVLEALGAMWQQEKQTFGPAAVQNMLQQRNAMLALKNAEFGLKQALLSLSDAEKAYQRAVEDAGEATWTANDQVRHSYENLILAQQRVVTAQDNLNRSTEMAVNNLRDLQFAAEHAALGEKEAATSLAAAMAAQRRTMTDANATMVDRQQAAEAVAEAQLRVREAEAQGKDSAEALQRAQQKGVAGSDAVRDATNENIAAIEGLIDAQHAMLEANKEQSRVAADTADNLAHLANSVDVARNSVEQAQESIASAKITMQQGSQANQAFAQSMAALSPAAQSFVEFMRPVLDTFMNVQKMAQEAFFPGFTTAMKLINDSLMPVLYQSLVDVAGQLGQLAQDFATKITTPESLQIIHDLLDSSARLIGQLGQGFIIVGENFAKFADAMRPLAEAFATMFNNIAVSFGKWIDQMTKSGEFNQWIMLSVAAFQSLVDITHALFNFLLPIMKDAIGPGTRLIEMFADFINQLAWFVGSHQKEIKTFFDNIVVGIKPFLDAIVQAAPDILKMTTVIAEGFAKMAPEFAKIIPLAAKLLEGFFIIFTPILERLLPFILQAADIFGGALLEGFQKIVPLLPKLVDSFGTLLEKLAGPLGDMVIAFLTIMVGLFTEPEFLAAIVRIADALADFFSNPQNIQMIIVLMTSAVVLMSLIIEIFDKLVGWTQTGIEWFQKFADKVDETWRDIMWGAGVLWGYLEDFMNWLMTPRSVWDWIVSGLQSAVEIAITALNFLIGGLNAISIDFDVPDWVPFGLGGKSFHLGFDIPLIPDPFSQTGGGLGAAPNMQGINEALKAAGVTGAAAGANLLTGGMLRVGEHGEETVFLPAGATVAPFSVEDLPMRGGGTTVNNYIAGSVVTERELIEATRQSLKNDSRLNAGGILAGV